MKTPVSKLAITPGDPAGVGFDILIKAVQQQQANELVAFCDARALQARARQLKLPLELLEHDASRGARELAQGSLSIVDIHCPANVTAGVGSREHGQYVLSCLDHAIKACITGELTGLVTGPVNKYWVNQSLANGASEHQRFRGHTEYLADRMGSEEVVMLLAVENPVALTRPLRVALATTHMPLSQVPSAINPRRLHRCVEIIHRDFKKYYKIETPKIAVCGLNPHAGENGDLGPEEQMIINPSMASLRLAGFDVSDALPADTLFTEKGLQHYDVVLAMYHDQGLAPLKSHGFGSAVNITLGLPVIRCSVDHGTAYDIAGTGCADHRSLQHAIDTAAKLAVQ